MTFAETVRISVMTLQTAVLGLAAAAATRSDDLGRTWHPQVSITHGWQPLSGGVELRLNKRDWESGYVIAFGTRDQLVSRIEKIEGNILTLTDAASMFL